MKLYHVNNTPGLAKITPKVPVTKHDTKLKDRSVIYLSSIKAYAAAFSFPWKDTEVDLSSYDGGRTWTLTIPTGMKHLVEERRPVSLYTVEVSPTEVLSRVKGVPEYIANTVLETLNEERYRSAKDCMEQNGLKLRYIGEGVGLESRQPIMSKKDGVRASTIVTPLYHISFNGTLEGKWTPKAPDGDYDPADSDPDLHPEPDVPRISLSPTIEQCFQGVYANVKHLFGRGHKGLDFYVYAPDFVGDETVVSPKTLAAKRLIHDAHVTEEHCVLDSVNMKRVARVRIFEPKHMLRYYAFGVKAEEYYGSLPKDIKYQTLESFVEGQTPNWLRW